MTEQKITPLQRLLAVCMAACLSVMALLVFGNVVLRYVFNSGITWSEEMSRYLFVFMIFFGAALALIQHKHLAVDMLVEHLPQPLRKACILISSALMLYALWLMVDGAWTLGWINRNSYGPATGFPIWALYAGCLVMGILMAGSILMSLVRQLATERNDSAD
ncbi:TRAP transporter small permease [Pseudomonas seleniipraecipitans]|uniref:TRAP transporter small permease protein n=1 Tax=Phytopseudomonas seleniipraecipitans TaxID=640205 RepID=A0ABY5J5D3_9GAMM|nr:TRAP transporter small permease [Pseudomonas seleniipraecipitans]NQD79515.1 TRAP transporter small permease [Pseudomonas sp. CrR14]UUD63288.1 TRAP transporter small permease [Pseudomonas seleniipraecipitans]